MTKLKKSAYAFRKQTLAAHPELADTLTHALDGIVVMANELDEIEPGRRGRPALWAQWNALMKLVVGVLSAQEAASENVDDWTNRQLDAVTDG